MSALILVVQRTKVDFTDAVVLSFLAKSLPGCLAPEAHNSSASPVCDWRTDVGSTERSMRSQADKRVGVT